MDLKPQLEQREEDQEWLCKAHRNRRVPGHEWCFPQTWDIPTLGTMTPTACSWGSYMAGESCGVLLWMNPNGSVSVVHLSICANLRKASFSTTLCLSAVQCRQMQMQDGWVGALGAVQFPLFWWQCLCSHPFRWSLSRMFSVIQKWTTFPGLDPHAGLSWKR